MALYDEEPTPVPPKPEIPKPSSPKAEDNYLDLRVQEAQRVSDIGNYKSALINTRYTDLASLITYIGGSSLTVDYFFSVLDKDDESTAHSTDMSGSYQQYINVIALELKVQSTINPSDYDSENSEFNPKGTAVLYAGLKPNLNNVFIADIGDGRLAEFTVVNLKPLSYLKDAAYEIEYQITRYLTKEAVASLKSKTITTYYFDYEDIRNGGSGLLTETQVNYNETLTKAIEMLSTYHMTNFHDPEVESLVYNKGGIKTYDPFIPGVMRDILPIGVLNRLPVNRELNCQDPDSEKTRTVWNVLLGNTISLLPIVSGVYGERSVETFVENPEFGSVLYSGVENVIYPSKYKPEPKSGSELATASLEEGLKGLFGDDEPEEPVDPDFGIKVPMHPIHHDGGYVFSKAFYDQNIAEMSVFEVLVLNYLEGRVINVKILTDFIKESSKWTTEEKFYYIPVLVILANVALQQKSVS